MKRFIPFVSLLLLISTFVMTSCKKTEEIVINDDKLSRPVSVKLFQEEILSAKALAGTDLGAKFDHQSSIMDSTSDATFLRLLDKEIAESSYTFLPGKDSVMVDGVINAFTKLEQSLARVSTKLLQGNKIKLKYKFENGQFLVDLSEFPTFGKEWVTVGYGDKEKFSIYVNYKYISYIYTHGTGTFTDLVEFVNPSQSIPNQDEVWATKFFDFLPEWTKKESVYRALSMSHLPNRSQIIEELKRYDFKAKDS